MRKQTIQVVREVFDIPDSEPLIFLDRSKKPSQWQKLWDKLLGGEHDSCDLGTSQ